MTNQTTDQEMIPESKAARWAYHLALVPILGLFLYMFAAFVALYQIGKGRTGFFLLGKGFWRMFRMTSAGIIGFAACWFCPFFDSQTEWDSFYEKPSVAILFPDPFIETKIGVSRYDHNIDEEDITYGFPVIKYGVGYSIRNFRYSPKHLKFGTWTIYGEIDGKEYKLTQEYWFNERSGMYKEWDVRGRLVEQGKYKNDKREGKWTSWYKGHRMGEIEYLNGLREGNSTTWYYNGQKHMEGIYKNDKRDGKWFIWNEDGIMEKEGEYRNGSHCGTWKYWDESGDLSKEETYDDTGKLISSKEYPAPTPSLQPSPSSTPEGKTK